MQSGKQRFSGAGFDWCAVARIVQMIVALAAAIPAINTGNEKARFGLMV
ncbi:hypothetical protein LBMAG51_09610 [Phycisphaerae bacterium]|nr:hypothetical protein LBMAG51_09610 [Phycisphaerae bacterium]